MKQDDNTEKKIGNDFSEDTEVSTIFPDIQEYNMDIQQEIKPLGLVRRQ